MQNQIKQAAEKAADEIADQFVSGFFDDRMVADVANIIYKHNQHMADSIVSECVRYFVEDYQRDFNVKWREDLSKNIKQHFGVKE